MKEQSKSSQYSRWKLLGVIPVFLAIFVVVLLIKSKSGPRQKDLLEISRVMRVITVPKVDLIPRTGGYGTAEPGKVWRAVAEVRGRVVEVNPGLQAGVLLKKDDLLLKIDPSEYELSAAVIQAGISQNSAELTELTSQEGNVRSSLGIEKRSLLLAEQSLQRKQELFRKKGISANEVEQEERNVLIQRQRVQDLENALSLIPSKREALKAKMTSNEAALQKAQLDLTKTVIKAPFDCRISTVSMETDQYLSAGQVLFEAHGTAVSEIEAQILGEQLRHLIGLQEGSQLQMPKYMEAMRQLTNMKAVVRINSGNWNIEWEARVDRLRESVDPATRAFSVVVAVDKPYEKVIPGQRPPLSRGLFCEVELQGAPRRGSIIIPRSALHNDTVYILDAANRLQPVKVFIAFFQDNLAVIDAGLAGGETLIVSDPTPAITGMLVEPMQEMDLQERLIRAAQAETVL